MPNNQLLAATPGAMGEIGFSVKIILESLGGSGSLIARVNRTKRSREHRSMEQGRENV